MDRPEERFQLARAIRGLESEWAIAAFNCDVIGSDVSRDKHHDDQECPATDLHAFSGRHCTGHDLSRKGPPQLPRHEDTGRSRIKTLLCGGSPAECYRGAEP